MFGVSFASNVDEARENDSNEKVKQSRLRMSDTEKMNGIDEIEDAAES